MQGVILGDGPMQGQESDSVSWWLSSSSECPVNDQKIPDLFIFLLCCYEDRGKIINMFCAYKMKYLCFLNKAKLWLLKLFIRHRVQWRLQ